MKRKICLGLMTVCMITTLAGCGTSDGDQAQSAGDNGGGFHGMGHQQY